MKGAKSNTAKAKRTEKQISDPRFAAFVRLLARHAARKDFERECAGKTLSGSQNGGYSLDSLAGDEE